MTECGALGGLGAPPPLDEGVAVERKPAASVHHRHRPVHPDTGGHGALHQDHGHEVIMSHTGLTSALLTSAVCEPLYSESSLRSWWKVTSRQNTLMIIQRALDT